jgi:hypothetical protein
MGADVYRPIIDNESNDFNYFRIRTLRIKLEKMESGDHLL